MKFKQTTLAVLLALSAGAAMAGPVLQACNPMQITHSSTSGISYDLHCEAGQWGLHYAGSVPAGDDAVTAHYRLTISGPANEELVQNRSIRLTSPAALGQMLMREAVVLESGGLALRECKEVGCTQYRPLLGSIPKQVKSTVRVERTDIEQADRRRLLDEIASLKGEMAALKANAEKEREAAIAAEHQRGEVQLANLQAEFDAYKATASQSQKTSQEGDYCHRQPRPEDSRVVPERRILPIRIGEPAPGTNPVPDTVGHLTYSEDAYAKDVMATGRSGRYLKNAEPEPAAHVAEPTKSEALSGSPAAPEVKADSPVIKTGYVPLEKAKQPKKRYLNVYGQWYDMWTTPPMPVAAPSIGK